MSVEFVQPKDQDTPPLPIAQSTAAQYFNLESRIEDPSPSPPSICAHIIPGDRIPLPLPLPIPVLSFTDGTAWKPSFLYFLILFVVLFFYFILPNISSLLSTPLQYRRIYPHSLFLTAINFSYLLQLQPSLSFTSFYLISSFPSYLMSILPQFLTTFIPHFLHSTSLHL